MYLYSAVLVQYCSSNSHVSDPKGLFLLVEKVPIETEPGVSSARPERYVHAASGILLALYSLVRFSGRWSGFASAQSQQKVAESHWFPFSLSPSASRTAFLIGLHSFVVHLARMTSEGRVPGGLYPASMRLHSHRRIPPRWRTTKY
jgi:hypothetical protein